MKKTILHSVKILDLSRILAGPYCAQILSDQGASVIKIESPDGDETRKWGPPFRNGESAYFFGMNRNKKSVVLSLTDPTSKKALHQLLSQSDVLIENFKLGDLKKFGLSDRIIRQKYPRLIHCQISGFGTTGEFKNYPGYDAAIQAWSGLMSINGAHRATKVGVPIVDLVTGQNAAFAIMAALFERSVSGRGQKIETSLLENAFSILHPHTSNFFFSQNIPKPLGNAHPNIAPYDSFETSSGQIYIACGTDRQFERLCAVLNFKGSLEKFKSNELRVKNRKQLEQILRPLFLKQNALKLAKLLLKNGVPAGPVLNLKQAFDLNQVRSLKIVEDHEFIVPPFKFSRSKKIHFLPAPKLGAQTQEVLRELNLTRAEMKNILSQQSLRAQKK